MAKTTTTRTAAPRSASAAPPRNAPPVRPAQAARPAQPAPRAATAAPPQRAAAPAQRVPAEPKNQQVAKLLAGQAPGAVAIHEDMTQLPAFMQNDIGKGVENIKAEDMEVPRLKLMQGISPELQMYNDLRAGQFLHTASETILPDNFLGVPIYMDRRYILWNPRGAGGGILARADDGVNWSPSSGAFKVKLDKKDGGAEVQWVLAPTVRESGLAEWGTMNPEDPNSPPAATLMLNYLLAFPEIPDLMPAVFTFQRSTLKSGKRFSTKLRTVRRPSFGLVFRFSSFIDHNSRGEEFQNVQAAGVGLVADEGAYNEYKRVYEGMSAAGLRIRDEDSLQEEQIPDDGQDQGGDGKRPGF